MLSVPVLAPLACRLHLWPRGQNLSVQNYILSSLYLFKFIRSDWYSAPYSRFDSRFDNSFANVNSTYSLSRRSRFANLVTNAFSSPGVYAKSPVVKWLYFLLNFIFKISQASAVIFNALIYQSLKQISYYCSCNKINKYFSHEKISTCINLF